MKTIREIRKAKGLTLEALSKACGVSAKTILQYEHEAPKRPSRKVIEKLAKGLGLTPEEFMKIALAPANGADEAEAVELSEVHVTRVLGLLEKEIRELQLLLLDYAEMQEEHPALGQAMDYIEADINLLIEIKGFFA